MCILADQKTKLVGMVKNSETEIKDEILEEAQKLFRQFGLKKTTMDEIATACGKAKSMLQIVFDLECCLCSLPRVQWLATGTR